MPQNEWTIGPTIITPEPETPIVIPPDPAPIPHVFMPLRFDGKVPASHETEAFFSQKYFSLRSENLIPTIRLGINVQERIEQTYQASLPQLSADIDAEISATKGSEARPLLESTLLEKSIIDSMLVYSTTELVKANEAAAGFLGRPFLAADKTKNALDLFNTIYRHPERTPLDLYSGWETAASSAYRAKFLHEKIRILSEKAGLVAHAVATAQVEEKLRLAAVEAKRLVDEAAAVEAARLAASEQARLAAQAQVIADNQARAAAQSIRIANTFRVPLSSSTTYPVVLTAAGTVAVIDSIGVTLQAAIRSAITALASLLAGTTSGLLVGMSALVYSPKLANGELPDRYALSTALSDLTLDPIPELAAIAAAGGAVDLPVRLTSKTAAGGQSEVIVVQTGNDIVPSKVNVILATFDTEQNLYAVTTGDIPPRTLIWTPAVTSGNNSTTSPVEQSEPPVYTGAVVIPVEGRVDSFPSVAEASFNDFITVFPADSGLPPVYVMFRDAREDPGVSTGLGQPVTGTWLSAASQGTGAPIPVQIADQLRGIEYRNFRAFREAFWKAVSKDVQLSLQFAQPNLNRMQQGRSPVSIESEWAGAASKFELHHLHPIAKGGAVYEIDNIAIVTPKHHKKIHIQGN